MNKYISTKDAVRLTGLSTQEIAMHGNKRSNKEKEARCCRSTEPLAKFEVA